MTEHSCDPVDHFMTPFYANGRFGAYPTDTELEILRQMEFDFIVRLTLDLEKNVEPYATDIPQIHIPIKDNNVPQDWEYFSFQIVQLVELLRTGKRMFIHCKGGHGRSCLVVACILHYVTDTMNARDAIEETIRIHNQRTNMSIRWKGIKSPFSKSQYIFLYKFLNPICILKSYNTGYQAGFSGSSLFQLEHPLGTFSNLDAAYQTIRAQSTFTDPYTEMLALVWMKFRAYPDLQENLIRTGIRRIYDHSRYAFGQNMIGRCLMDVRHTLILEYLVLHPHPPPMSSVDTDLNKLQE